MQKHHHNQRLNAFFPTYLLQTRPLAEIQISHLRINNFCGELFQSYASTLMESFFVVTLFLNLSHKLISIITALQMKGEKVSKFFLPPVMYVYSRGDIRYSFVEKVIFYAHHRHRQRHFLHILPLLHPLVDFQVAHNFTSTLFL
jgi:hypothetical protein